MVKKCVVAESGNAPETSDIKSRFSLKLFTHSFFVLITGEISRKAKR